MFKKRISAMLIASMALNILSCAPTKSSHSEQGSSSSTSSSLVAVLQNQSARIDLCEAAALAIGRRNVPDNACVVPDEIMKQVSDLVGPTVPTDVPNDSQISDVCSVVNGATCAPEWLRLARFAALSVMAGGSNIGNSSEFALTSQNKAATTSKINPSSREDGRNSVAFGPLAPGVAVFGVIAFLIWMLRSAGASGNSAANFVEGAAFKKCVQMEMLEGSNERRAAENCANSLISNREQRELVLQQLANQ